MKIVISQEGCMKNNISIGEVLLLLSYYIKSDFESSQDLLVSKGYITSVSSQIIKDYPWRVTNKGIETINNVIIDSEAGERSMDELLELAEKLKAIFPTGRKEGTSSYWTEGKILIARRLKVFFKKYGNSYTNDQIIQAAEKYVEGFNGNYQFMKTLKYFIFKDKVVEGEKDNTSDLLTYIENAGQEEILRSDWTSTIE